MLDLNFESQVFHGRYETVKSFPIDRLFPSPKVQASPKPMMKALPKPKAITKGEKEGGFFSSRLCREEDSSLTEGAGFAEAKDD